MATGIGPAPPLITALFYPIFGPLPVFGVIEFIGQKFKLPCASLSRPSFSSASTLKNKISAFIWCGGS